LTVPRVKLLGDIAEAEKLRGFALSQLQILHGAMKFQGLKQYTRVVRFCDGSYVRAFSSFGLDLITVFVPPISIPEREIVEVEEGVYIVPEPCEVALEIPVPQVTTDCTWQWVWKSHDCVLSGVGSLTNYACDSCNRTWTYELIIGNKKQVQGTTQSCWNDGMGPGGYANCIDPVHNPPEEVAWDFYTDYSGCAVPEDCDVCDSPQKVEALALHYYEWECV
jgi:hypothetical protein